LLPALVATHVLETIRTHSVRCSLIYDAYDLANNLHSSRAATGYQERCESSELTYSETEDRHRGGFMKKHTLLLGLSLLLIGTVAYARNVNLKVNVPFDFVVNGATLPSGEYSVQGLALGNAISIRNADYIAKALVLGTRCQSPKTSEKAKLVFHRYGNRYFLAQIWMAGDNAGVELAKSRLETEIAQSRTAEEVVLVAALR
jgi:hypothetical protein